MFCYSQIHVVTSQLSKKRLNLLQLFKISLGKNRKWKNMMWKHRICFFFLVAVNENAGLCFRCFWVTRGHTWILLLFCNSLESLLFTYSTQFTANCVFSLFSCYIFRKGKKKWQKERVRGYRQTESFPSATAAADSGSWLTSSRYSRHATEELPPQEQERYASGQEKRLAD